jgi:DNA-directed RNA polymerase specialized sigma24 family protein
MSGIVELECIVKVHAAMVRRIATAYERYPDRVEELVQNVWIAVWQAPPLDEARAHAMRLACLIEAVASLYLEDIPIKHIALALGISESNASVRLHRAKSAIRLSIGDLS